MTRYNTLVAGLYMLLVLWLSRCHLVGGSRHFTVSSAGEPARLLEQEPAVARPHKRAQETKNLKHNATIIFIGTTELVYW